MSGKTDDQKALDEKIKNLEDGSAIKDASIEELQDANKLLIEQLKTTNGVLIDQLKFRWSSYQSLVAWVPGVLGTFFTFGLACAFAYQIYKADEARKLTTGIQNQSTQINKQVAKQAQIMANLALVVGNLDVAQREFANGRYSRSAVEAESSLKVVEAAQAILNNQETEEKQDHTTQDEGTTTINLVKPMQEAVDEMRISCSVLAAQAHFSLATTLSKSDNRSNLETVRKIGEELKERYKDRWEGYHFVGIGNSEDGNYAAAVEPLEKAVEISRRQNLPVNLDLQNLAETYFVLGKYSNAEINARAYIESDPNAINDVKAVNTFFLDMSQFMISGNPLFLHEFERTLEDILYPKARRNADFHPANSLEELISKASNDKRKISTVYSTVALRAFYTNCQDKYTLEKYEHDIPELKDDYKRGTMLKTLNLFTSILDTH